jgi:hypothetical protein
MAHFIILESSELKNMETLGQNRGQFHWILISYETMYLLIAVVSLFNKMTQDRWPANVLIPSMWLKGRVQPGSLVK